MTSCLTCSSTPTSSSITFGARSNYARESTRLHYSVVTRAELFAGNTASNLANRPAAARAAPARRVVRASFSSAR